MAKDKQPRLVCIGGGHGLGCLLSALQSLGENLCGIVATTDNGGSTGRLRNEVDTIAWGDLRYCLNQLCQSPGINQLLFEYRFSTEGSLNGHNLGNLMLYALDQLSVRPTDAIEIMRSLLQIKPRLYPMAEEPLTLIGLDGEKEIIGELAVDQYRRTLTGLKLDKPALVADEVVAALRSADGILLAPGSFMTSVMPSLLLDAVKDEINQSQARLVLVANLQAELLGKGESSYPLDLSRQLYLLHQAGIRKPDIVLWPAERESELFSHDIEVVVRPMANNSQQLHDRDLLQRAIASLFSTAA